MKNKNETNVQFISRVMKNAKTGPLLQCVVIEAIGRYVKDVTTKEADYLKAMEGTALHGPAWVAACKELQTEVDTKYGKH